MDLVVGHTLALDVFVNRAALFLIVAERVEHLGERKVGQPQDDFFGSDTEFPQFGNGSYRRARSDNDGSAVENFLGADNIRMSRGGCHVRDRCQRLFDGVSLLGETWDVNLIQPSVHNMAGYGAAA